MTFPLTPHLRCPGTYTGLMLSLLLVAPSLASAQVADTQASMHVHNSSSEETLHITVGQSMMLRSDSAMKRVFVGNPLVLQSFNSSPTEITLTAKAPGISSLAMWDMSGKTRLYTISADIDPSGMRRAVREIYPDATIDVQGIEDRIALNGDVASIEISDNLTKLAGAYSKQVANSLRVVTGHAKQVQLKLRIVEVDRTKLDQFAVNLSTAGKVPASTSTQAFPSPLNLSIAYLKESVTLNIQDLAQRSVLQVLAEPTLTTLSGQPARFLSGGEFPFPVAQAGAGGGQAAVTIQFRPYGVKVDFVPTINTDGTIQLKVAPEVSALDYANAVTISGFTVPALSTRRAETQVELKDGESFVLSGLLDRRTTENFGRIPGIASVPVLGQLFRSKNNSHSVTELVFIVTATIIDPLRSAPPIAEPVMVHPNMTPEEFDRDVPRPSSTDKQP